MIQLYWLEQAEADLPSQYGWLAAAEALRLKSFRFPKRRADWLLGRWTAKNAVAIHLGLPVDANSLANVEIRQTPSGAPDVLVANQPAPLVISLSHRSGRSICALAPAGEAIGCDLEVVEPRSDAFIGDYFAAEEQAVLAHTFEEDRAWVVTLLWSAKESALKALREGLRLDTRSVTVRLADPQPHRANESPPGEEGWLSRVERPETAGGWRRLWVRHSTGQVFPGWWLHAGGFVRTAVTGSPSAAPIPLALATGKNLPSTPST